MAMKNIRYIPVMLLLCCCGCGQSPIPAPVVTAPPTVEFRIAVTPNELSEMQLKHLVLALNSTDGHNGEQYEWVQSCGKHSWSHQAIDTALLSENDELMLYKWLFAEDLIVARMGGLEYILVCARANTIASDTRGMPSYPTPTHLVVDVHWADVEWNPRARGGQGAMAPGLILTSESAQAMSRFAQDHLLARMVVIIDDCAFGFARFSGVVLPQFFQQKGFFIDGDFQREDVLHLIKSLQNP